MIYRVLIWEKTTGEHLPVGEMVSEIADGVRPRCAFRYHRDYLRRADAFALDPVSLPLGSESFSADSPIFGVFDDSLPDSWGRKLLVRKYSLPRQEQSPPNLLLILGNAGMGALTFSSGISLKEPAQEVSILNLSELVAAAEDYENGEVLDTDLAMLFSAGSSPGGARPKAVVFDEQENIHYLAKFPSVNDQVDMVRIEAATMNLAEKAGLVVPDTGVVLCANKPVLLVNRFDVIPGGRRHMISFQTLLKAYDYYQLRYQDLLTVIRKYSNDPRLDSERLFRQMVFNSLVGNIDDHLKNFWMIHDHRHGWRLSPAFDLIPDVAQKDEHTLFFDISGFYPGRKRLEAMGKHWGISNTEGVINQVFDAVQSWKEKFDESGVTEKDIRRFKSIDIRLDS